MKLYKNRNRGFTLLELLIVLGILVILAVVIIIAVNPAEMLRKSRDVQRLSDLATLKKALSLYVTTVNSPDLDSAVDNLCFTPSNTAAKIAYSYNDNLSGCTATVAEGADVTSGATFNPTNFCFSKASHNIYSDFSTTTNPVPGGIWQYGTKATVTNASITTASIIVEQPCTTGGPMLGWADAGNIIRIQKHMSATTCAIPAAQFSMPPEHVRIFQLNTAQYATVRWTAPRSGTYTIAGTINYTGSYSDTSYVVHNTTQIYSGSVDAGTPSQSFNLSRTVVAGDTIDIVNGSNVNTSYTATITPTSDREELVKAIDGTGWVPVDFTSVPGGSPISALPVDPRNTIANTSAPASTDLVYRYSCQQSAESGKPFRVFEIDAQLESAAFTQTENKLINDGGDNENYYEIGTSLRLIGDGTNF